MIFISNLKNLNVLPFTSPHVAFLNTIGPKEKNEFS